MRTGRTERVSFRSCQGDVELRREVDALFTQDDASATVTQIGAGMQIESYRIEALLGEGSMGVVYRAVDTKLNRPVAIKFEAFAYYHNYSM